MHKGKGMQHPQPNLSEAQAREKLAVYVHEYLVHNNFQQTAKMFLNEMNWNKQSMQVGEAPGFLISWWSVFWDLYLAATPDRRDQYEPSNDAKMFHDYTNNMNPQMVPPPAPPQEMAGTPSPMMAPNNQFFGPPGSQPASIMNQNQQFQRFPQGQRGGMRMDFNANNPNNNQMPQGRGPPPLPPNQQQQVPPPNQPPHMNFNGAQRPPPPQQQPPQPPGTPVGGPMSPMSMQQPQRWNPGGGQAPQTPGGGPMQQMPPNMAPPSHNMGYSSTPSPLSYGGGNVPGGMPPMGVQPGGGGVPGPGTPGGLMSSPPDGSGGQGNQGPPNDLNFNNMIKGGGGGGGMQFAQDPNMGHMVQMNQDMGGPPQHHPHLANEMMDSIKNSPIQNMQVNRHPEEHVGGGGGGGTGGGPDLNSFGQYGDPGVNLF